MQDVRPNQRGRSAPANQHAIQPVIVKRVILESDILESDIVKFVTVKPDLVRRLKS
jgi:hypothetical protein